MGLDSFFEPVLLALGMVAVTSLMLLVYISTRHSRYDMELKRAEIELLRKSMESKIYAETEKLTAKENRWKDVNHLVVEAQEYASDTSDLESEFVRSAGVRAQNNKINKRKVFILTPFHDRYDETYNVIRGVCEEAGLSAYRGDEKYISGNILSHIIKEIASASVVIANLDGRNPNVFYELGIVHAMGKPVIMVSSNIDGVPFDLQSQRIIVYENIEKLKSKLNSALTNLIVGI